MTGVSSDFVTGGARVAALTSGTAGVTTQDITDSNMGVTPKAVILIVSLATTNDTVVAGVGYSIGMTDGTTEGAISCYFEDNVTTMTGGRFTHDGRVAHLADDTGTIALSLSFDSFISNGVRVIYETIPSSAYLIQAIFFGGDTADIHVGIETTSSSLAGTVDVTAPGHEPAAVIGVANGLGISGGETTSAISGTYMGMGMATWNGSTAEFGYNLSSYVVGGSNSYSLHTKNIDRFIRLGVDDPGSTPIYTNSVAIGSFDSNGFTLTTADTARATSILYMSINTGTDDVEIQFERFDTGNAIGNVSESGINFGPQSVLWMLTEGNKGTDENRGAPGGPWGIGYFDANVEYATSICSEDNVTTSNCGSLSSDSCGLLIDRNVATSGMDGTFSSLNDDGYTINFTSEIGGGKWWYALVFKQNPTVIDPALEDIEFAGDAEPFTPVITPVGVLEIDALEPTPLVPVRVALENIVVAGSAEAVTPVVTALDDLLLSATAEPVSPVSTPVGILELTADAEPFTPVQLPLAGVESEAVDALPVTPITASAELELDATAQPFTPIVVGLAGLEFQEIEPEINTALSVDVSSVQYTVLEPDIVTPVAIGFVDLKFNATAEPVTPVLTQVTGLELEALVDVIAPVLASLESLVLGVIEPTLFDGAPTTVVVPLSDLEYLVFEPDIDSDSGCYERTANALRARLEAIGLSQNIIYDNDVDEPQTAQHIRASIDWLRGEHHEVGITRRYRKTGNFLLRIYSPMEEGDQSGYALIDQIKPTFRIKQFSDIVYVTPAARNVGLEHSWHVQELRIPFYVDELVTKTVIVGGYGVPDFEQIANTTRNRFKTLVADVENLPTQYDNAPFDPPDNTVWCRFSILPGDSVKADTGGSGNDRFRNPGVAQALVRVPVETGDQLSLSLMDKINTAFRAVTDSGVVYQTPSVTRIGRNGAWYDYVITIPYYADELG